MPSSLLSQFFCLVILCAFICIWMRRASTGSQKKSFPSPPAEPFIGHLRIFPRQYPWLKLTEWSKQYGGIIQLSLAGKSVLVVNTAEQANKLMDKKGNNNSDRPHSVLQGELAGFDRLLGFIHHGDEFRMLRRFVAQYFNSKKSVSLHPLLVSQVKILLKNILEEPEKLEHHLDRFSSGIIVKSTYGYDITSREDAYVQLAAETGVAFTSMGIPGVTPLDFFPLLKYLPEWAPGSGLKRKAMHARKLLERMMSEPYERVKSDRILGRNIPSFVASLIKQLEGPGNLTEENEMHIKSTASQIYIAGTETAAVSLISFVYFMLVNPEVARKAQSQIDQSIGGSRLPTIADRPNIPYIDCIANEIFRFNPPVPLGVPHSTVSDDIHEGKFIPAGTLIIPNIWAMMRDGRYFKEPDRFNPDRFQLRPETLESDLVHPLNTFRPDDPRSLCFGFGRRICPGRYYADSSNWLVIASVLAVFDVLPPIDPATGKEYIPEFEWIDGLSSKPKPFACRLLPRSEKHIHLIHQNCP